MRRLPGRWPEDRSPTPTAASCRPLKALQSCPKGLKRHQDPPPDPDDLDVAIMHQLIELRPADADDLHRLIATDVQGVQNLSIHDRLLCGFARDLHGLLAASGEMAGGVVAVSRRTYGRNLSWFGIYRSQIRYSTALFHATSPCSLHAFKTADSEVFRFVLTTYTAFSTSPYSGLGPIICATSRAIYFPRHSV